MSEKVGSMHCMPPYYCDFIDDALSDRQRTHEIISFEELEAEGQLGQATLSDKQIKKLSAWDEENSLKQNDRQMSRPSPITLPVFVGSQFPPLDF